MTLLSNGTYFNNWVWLPAIGYQTGRELIDSKQRQDYGLPKRREFRSVNDKAAVMGPSGKERIRVEATIGTVTEIPMQDMIEIGVYGKDKAGRQKILHLQKRKIHGGVNQLVIRLDEAPLKAGIAPLIYK